MLKKEYKKYTILFYEIYKTFIFLNIYINVAVLQFLQNFRTTYPYLYPIWVPYPYPYNVGFRRYPNPTIVNGEL